MVDKGGIVLAVGVSAILATGVIVFRKQIAQAIVLSPGQIVINPPSGSTFTPAPPPGTTPGTTPNLPPASPGSGGALSAKITADKTQGSAPLSVNFKSNAIGGIAPLNYRWAFGDGGVSSDPNPSYVFTQVGAYTVALSIVDAQGQEFTTFISISTNNLPPPPPPPNVQPIQGVKNSALNGQAPLTVGFSIAITDPTSSIAWDFGDPYAGTENPNTDSSFVVNHTYFKPGSYTVKLTVTSPKWGVQTKQFSILVTAPPVAGIKTNLFLSETAGPAPLYVAFSASLNVVQQSIVWDFGDGVKDSSGVLAIGHTYQNKGTYNGSLTVVSVDGQTVSTPFQVFVDVNPLLTVTASMIFSPGAITDPAGNPEVGIATMIEGQAGGGIGPFTYLWDFGDGTTGKGLQVTHTYSKAGAYTIILTITDSKGSIGSTQKGIVVVNGAIQVGDVSIIIVSNQVIPGAGGQFNSLQLQVKNNRPDVDITGNIAIRIFDNTTQNQIGTEIDSSNLTVQANSKIVVPPILTGQYQPGNKLLVIQFFDFTVTAKALAELDLSV